jgi:hypothetical protein
MKPARNILHLGLDVHKEKPIAVAIGSGDGSVRHSWWRGCLRERMEALRVSTGWMGCRQARKRHMYLHRFATHS